MIYSVWFFTDKQFNFEIKDIRSRNKEEKWILTKNLLIIENIVTCENDEEIITNYDGTNLIFELQNTQYINVFDERQNLIAVFNFEDLKCRLTWSLHKFGR